MAVSYLINKLRKRKTSNTAAKTTRYAYADILARSQSLTWLTRYKI